MMTLDSILARVAGALLEQVGAQLRAELGMTPAERRRDAAARRDARGVELARAVAAGARLEDLARARGLSRASAYRLLSRGRLLLARDRAPEGAPDE